MFPCVRVSDAVRAAVWMQEMREARFAHQGRELPIPAYRVDDWEHYMATPMDRLMAKFPE